MWSKEIFRFIDSNSKPDSSFSTYTTARLVKDGLKETRFKTEKRKGFGAKREMLCGKIPLSTQKIADRPWFRLPNAIFKEKKAIVIGGGLAGTSASYHLAEKGFSVTIIEEKEIAFGASGNPSGMFAPLLTADPSSISQWSITAYNEFSQFLEKYGNLVSGLFTKTGVFQTISSEEEFFHLQKAFSLSELKSSDCIFLEKGNSILKPNAGILFPNAGKINPYILSNAYISFGKNKVSKLEGVSAIRLEKNNSQWRILLSNNDTLESEIVIIANSFETKKLIQEFTEINKVRGQILIYPEKKFPQKIEQVILHESGYFIPNVKEGYLVGSTFNPNDFTTEVNREHNIILLQKLKNLFPEINPAQGIDFQGRVSFRAMSSDHLPMVGLVPDFIQFKNDYGDLWKSNIFRDYPNGKYFPGLFVTTAHGSKGILNSFLAGKILASIISGDSLPIEKELMEKINPSRFLIQSFINRSIV